MPDQARTLQLKFHGRILDSLGIQMYQSPVAAIAELIANGWDADATSVEIILPENMNQGAEIIIKDNGDGMTIDECQNKYLSVGRNRRETDRGRTIGGRPCLGRKGIGKFAGFGIAEVMRIETISGATGERVVFALGLNELRGHGDYVSTTPAEIAVVEYAPPEESRKAQKGTTIRLQSLKGSQRRSPEVFARFMAKRFLLAQQASNFRVTVNGLPLPDVVEPFTVQYEFPRDYRNGEAPAGMRLQNGWAEETLTDGNAIRWQVKFSEDTIKDEEFTGISVFCGIKVAQNPFFFQLSGGIGGQHGQQYMNGRVQADYLDHLSTDIITVERQRINWEDPNAAPLLAWGKTRVEQLLRLWKERRAEGRISLLNDRVSTFSARLARLPQSEARIVQNALRKLAGIETLKADQFVDLGNALLTAWEGGRLKDIIDNISRMDEMDDGVLLSILAEERILSALHIAEVVKAKVMIIQGLRSRISNRERENDIRDYIAENPWLISPEMETFKVETSLNVMIREALSEAGMVESDEHWRGRMDLVLRSGVQLIVLEFMRPGLVADRDHFDRYQHYIDVLRTRIAANTTLGIHVVTGRLVADSLSRRPENAPLIERLRNQGMLCEEWNTLLEIAAAKWSDFLDILIERAPEDARLRALATLEPEPSTIGAEASAAE